MQVAGSILRQLEKATGRMVVVYADSAAAELARKSSGVHQVLSLQQACQQDSLSLPLLLVEPAVADVSDWATFDLDPVHGDIMTHLSVQSTRCAAALALGCGHSAVSWLWLAQQCCLLWLLVPTTLPT